MKAKALKPGDTVGIVAPSGIVHKESLLRGIKVLEELGLSVKVAPSVFNQYGYLAGTDEERARDINLMWADPEVKAIIAARGGYGAMRILPMIDFQIVRQHPKILVGYSDITALHLGFAREAGLITFHGPMGEVGENGMDQYNMRLFRDTLFGSWPLPSQGKDLLPLPEGVSLEPLTPGCSGTKEATGELTGGNLSLIVSTIGTPWEIDTRGKILFIEDVDEKPYRVDRMLCQLKLSRKLNDAAGFLVGEFTDCEAEKGRPSFTVSQLIQQYLTFEDKPCLINVPAGHGRFKAMLPMGVRVSISTDPPAVRFLESPLDL